MSYIDEKHLVEKKKSTMKNHSSNKEPDKRSEILI